MPLARPPDGSQPPPRPPARHSHVAGTYCRDGLIVAGGAGLRGPLADVWLFEPGAARWRCLSADLGEGESPEAREMAAGCTIGDAGLLMHGGRGADGRLLSDLCIFDGRAGRWVLAQETGHPRCAHTASNAVVEDAAPAEAAAGEPAGGGSSGGGSGGAAGANVLLYGGFGGEEVVGDLLQLSFLRQHRGAGVWQCVLLGLGATLLALRAGLLPTPPLSRNAPQVGAGFEPSCGQWRQHPRQKGERLRHALRMRLRCCPVPARRQRWWWWAE